jgi:DMSO/TMAO reductase YedYZ molybdopterin-dependent catalytic subunit
VGRCISASHRPGYFYGTIRLELAEDPQTILAYEMNGQPLPILHGAPLRLRVETQLGFTMVKYIRAIEFTRITKTSARAKGLAGRLPVFQPGGGHLIREVWRFPEGSEDRD